MGRTRRRRRPRDTSRMILVHAIKSDKFRFQDKDGNDIEESYQRDVFHLVDLKRDKVNYDCLPSLPRSSAYNIVSVVASARSIFMFGWRDLSSDEASFINNYTKSTGEHVFTGDSCIHFDPDKRMVVNGGKWAGAPLTNSYSRNFTCLNGDVYSFPPTHKSAPEVLHLDSEGHGSSWKSLPVPRDVNRRSRYYPFPVMADPTNNRILVHLEVPSCASVGLYAFYPRKDDGDGDDSSSGTWRCLHPRFRHLYGLLDVSLLDGVVYHYYPEFSDLLMANDVDSGKRLDIKWSTRVIKKGLSIDDCVRPTYFSSLLCLDDTNKILCLARKYRNPPSNVTTIFFTFKAMRQHDSTIILTPLYVRSYELLSTAKVFNFCLL